MKKVIVCLLALALSSCASVGSVTASTSLGVAQDFRNPSPASIDYGSIGLGADIETFGKRNWYYAGYNHVTGYGGAGVSIPLWSWENKKFKSKKTSTLSRRKVKKDATKLRLFKRKKPPVIINKEQQAFIKLNDSLSKHN